MEKKKVIVEGKNGNWEFNSVKDASKYIKKGAYWTEEIRDGIRIRIYPYPYQ